MLQGGREGCGELKLAGGLVLGVWSPSSGGFTPGPAARAQLSAPFALSFLSRSLFLIPLLTSCVAPSHVSFPA